jgi:hypothetical protein
MPCLVTVTNASGGRKTPELMRFPAPEVTSIIVDQRNRKSLLSFMVHIRQHPFNAWTSHLSAFLPRIATGKQDWAVRVVLNHA